uniref:Uncharacterized protein n=1 Tax=Ditylenchus dipsaci TaxID=166011 RepID=A0A915E5P2_9BILA
MSCSSILSIISPIKKTPTNGPKTSSPKFLLPSSMTPGQHIKRTIIANTNPSTPMTPVLCSSKRRLRNMEINGVPAVASGTPTAIKAWKY